VPQKFLALDPGGTTGYAVFNEEGNCIDMGEVFTKEELRELLNDTKPTTVICEDWKTKKDVRLGGDPLETVRIIGRVEEWCDTQTPKVRVVLQLNTVKGIAYKMAGAVKPKNKKLEHRMDAYVHGVYFLERSGVRYPQQAAAGNDRG
jgi:acyl carrier protein